MKLEDTKFISFGGGCFSNILLTRLDKLTGYNIRTAGPIDNLRSIHGIVGSLKLFDKSLEEQLIGAGANPLITNKKDGKKAYDECEQEFKFEDFAIIHNDWRTQKCKDELKRRFNNFYEFVKNAEDNSNYHFLYTLCEFDNRSIEELNAIKDILIELGIYDKCIFVGTEIAAQPIETYTLSNQVNWPNFNFENWKAVFGDKYIVITDSNYYDLAAEKFLNILKGE